MKKYLTYASFMLVLVSSTAYSVDSCTAVFKKSAEKSESTNLLLKDVDPELEEIQFRDGPAAVHMYLESGEKPYAFFGFPAGNSGVSIWMKRVKGMGKLVYHGEPVRVSADGNQNGAAVNIAIGDGAAPQEIVITDSILGSMRFIRDRELNAPIPALVAKTTRTLLTERSVKMVRTSLDGIHEFRLDLAALGDTRISQTVDGIHIFSPTKIQFRMSGSTNETPLVAMPVEKTFKAADLKMLTALKKTNPVLGKAKERMLKGYSFLSYVGKILAGAPRYFSRFTRDTCVTLHVLKKHMLPQAQEETLISMLSTVDLKTGEPSHEQTEGDFAGFMRMMKKKKHIGVETPIEDFKMIDVAFLLADNLAEYLAENPTRAEEFLKRTDARGVPVRDLVKANFERVHRRTQAFADVPTRENLIRLHKGHTTGQWRDSDDGLFGAKVPFDVNAALVPGALKAMSTVYGMKEISSLYDPAKSAATTKSFEVWNTKVVDLFKVTIPVADLWKFAEAYYTERGMDIADLPPTPTEDLTFPAIGLDENLQPVPVMHSDDTMMMEFGHPSAEFLASAVKRVTTAFPYGLYTPAGVMISNAFALPRAKQALNDVYKYHQRVSWGMQEDLYISGIKRQMARQDLSVADKKNLNMAQQAVYDAIEAKESMAGVETFSMFYEKAGQTIQLKNGKTIFTRWVARPFKGDARTNRTQLWSLLRLFDDLGE